MQLLRVMFIGIYENCKALQLVQKKIGPLSACMLYVSFGYVRVLLLSFGKLHKEGTCILQMPAECVVVSSSLRFLVVQMFCSGSILSDTCILHYHHSLPYLYSPIE